MSLITRFGNTAPLTLATAQRLSATLNNGIIFVRPLGTSSKVTASATLKNVLPSPPIPPTQKTGLQRLPTSALIRSLAVLSVASLPPPILTRIIRAAKRRSAWIDAAPVVGSVARRSFYDNFCIGENSEEIARNVAALRDLGCKGIILGFAREAVPSGSCESAALTPDEPALRSWVQSNLETLEKLQPDDYLGIRCTGAGPATLRLMDGVFAQGLDAASADEVAVFRNAMHEVCADAARRGVKVLVDAEDTKRQVLIDHVALDLMATYNTGRHAVVLNTYQMYLKSGVEKLKSHVEHSLANNYTMGAKLVRGAFLSTEPRRNLVHDNKADTDAAYDRAVQLLITGDAPVDVLLATHNSHSAMEALRLYQESGKGLRSLSFAQLKGMADDLSFALTAEIERMHVDRPIGVYKYSIWGSFQECLLYMLRRAEENQDAVGRSKATAKAMLGELWARMSLTRTTQL